jgi:citrate lyase subunit beta/citryl-CoA lyase
MDLLRSLLVLPALDTAAVQAARASHADAVVLDLEDGVPLDAADAARAAAQAAAATLGTDHRRVWVRIHPTSTPLARADIRGTASEQVAGFVLPHALSAAHVRYAEALLRDAEAGAGLKDGSLRLIALIGSAEGLLAAREMSRVGGRLAALALDGGEFCADMGVERTREGQELQYARSHLAVCARAAGLLALDAPYPYTHDMQGLLTDTATARALGLQGKFVVAPEQVAFVNAVFRPTAEEVAHARRLVAAREAMQDEDGYAQVDGRIIDAPRARRARRLIELADAIAAKEQRASI